MKNNLIILLLSFIWLTSNNAFCMLSRLKYPAYLQPNDPAIIAAREFLNADEINFEEAAKHSIILHRSSSAEEDKLDIRCAAYATKKITDLTFDCFGTNANYWNIGLQLLFKQLKAPEKDCLVVWIVGENNLTIQHFGQLISDPNGILNWKDLIVESKWGNLPIMRSPLFNTLPNYGTGILFFNLKKEYTNNKTSLLQLQKSINLKVEQLEVEQQQKQKLKSIVRYGTAFGIGIILGSILFPVIIDTK